MKQYSESKSDVLMFTLKEHTVTDISGKLAVKQGSSDTTPVKTGGMVCQVYEDKLCVIPGSLTHKSNIVLKFEPALENNAELFFCDRLDNGRQRRVNIDGEVSTLEVGYDRDEGLFISYECDTKEYQQDFCEANTERIGERITMLKNTVSVYSASSGGKEDESLNKVFALITQAETILAKYISDRQKKSEKDTVIG